MSKFNKLEYNILYNKDNRHPLNLGMSKDEYDKLCAYCTNISVNRTAYIKKLINEDAIKNGYPAIFIDGRKKQDI